MLLCPTLFQAFVDSTVVFINRRLGALLEALDPKDIAYTFAVRMRRHVQAHDATTAALGIRAGRKRRSVRARGRFEDEQEEHDIQVWIEDPAYENIQFTWGASI